ncbi:MAG: hypothetical protein J1E84_02105 [Muribaculaceae bacterium]|nr:hypothetical protein [Muribaculaceae bacterium]
MKKLLIISAALLGLTNAMAAGALPQQNNPAGNQLPGNVLNPTIGATPTKTAYSRPLSGLFFGLTETGKYLPTSIMVGPVYSTVAYTNKTTPATATYTWSYIVDNKTAEVQTSTSRNLSVSYKTDYTNAFTTRNNLYKFPTLTASTATTDPTDFTFEGFYQAGGRGEYETDGKIENYGLTVVDPTNEGQTTYIDEATGVPIFGYNKDSDKYWGLASLGEDDYDPENEDFSFSHLEKFGNFFYTPNAPIVVTGIRTLAYGKVKPGAVFVGEIFALNAGMEIGEEPIVKAECKAEDITVIEQKDGLDFMSLSFTFDEPVVISKSTIPYFFATIGGFRDAENVEYYAPLMSDTDNPNSLGLGWIGRQTRYMETTLPLSWGPTPDFTDDKLVAFYIMLDATFPWLESGESSLEITAQNPVSMTLDSYYDASELTFAGLPSWLSATATGRYDKTVVTFTATNVAADEEATVTIKAPGVSKDVKIVTKSSGISTVTADEAAETGRIYTLTGRETSAEGLTPGVYIKRHADGKAEKIVIR